jgi:very-short-patch-repair endonuclease|uniref:endonuclease domain-containing protein n=1 Tax=Nonlabens sp. Ci31 TaxID=2608253 RepID=UPI0019805D99|nr:endonuclease domain-containing protein [Nonlabens sp. Ci31]
MKKDKLIISGMHDGATPSVFRNAAKLRDSMTEAELKLWEYLKTKPLGFKVRRQHPIAGFILDFYCHKLRLSIEIDGGYHLKSEQRIKDKERRIYLEKLGISEIRFTNHQVLKEYEKVIHDVNFNLSAGTLCCIRRGFLAERNA